ncbi:mucD, partial [Symbiodinium sp. CCMP2456]
SAPALEDLQPKDLVFVGSAFLCGERSLATCAHLFEGRWPAVRSRGLVLRFGEGLWMTARLQGAAKSVDVAVLRLHAGGGESPVGPLVFSERLPRQGERVAVCGMTQFGTEVIGLSGLVSQPRMRQKGSWCSGITPAQHAGGFRNPWLRMKGPQDPATRFVQLALPTLPGMSGSPVFDADGKVIAMVAKKFEEHGLAIPADRVRIVIQCLEAGHGWLPPLLGLEVQESGTLLDPTVVVKAVRGRGAIAAGVQVGDEILAIGQTPVVDLLSMREGLSALGDSRSRRAGRCMEVSLETERSTPKAE